MRITLTVAARGSLPRDVVVDAPAGTSLGTGRELLAQASGQPRTVSWWSGRRLLPDTAVLGGPGLRTGAVVSAGGPSQPEPGEWAQLLHLAVVAGPDAGLTAPLARGVHVIGRGADCDLALSDDDVSRRHAAVTVSVAGISLRDLGSTNGTRCEGAVVDTDGAQLRVGQPVRIGENTVVVRAGAAAPPALRATEDGHVLVLRGPRTVHEPRPGELAVPSPPPARTRPRIAWVGALLPAVAGIGLGWALHTWQLLAFAALTPLTVLGTAANDRWSWRAGRRRAAADHAAACSEFETAVACGVAEEQAGRRQAQPDPATVLTTAAAPGCRLWERRLQDEDALCVRLGTANRPSRLLVREADGSSRPAGTVHDVPVLSDLRVGALGLAGPRSCIDGIVRALLGGLVTAHGPSDLDLVLLLSDGADADWDWLRWLPHRVRRASTPSTRARMLAEFTDRLGSVTPTSPWRADAPWTVVLVDRVGVLSAHPALTEVIERGRQAHLASVCLDDVASGLPSACATTAVVAGATGSRLDLAGHGWWPGPQAADAVGPVVADRADLTWAEGVSRGLAPLVTPDGRGGASLPDTVALTALLGAHDPSVLAGRWRRESGTTRPLRVPIGVGCNGTVELDLTTDGPHMLVAGTTGSGKSELLQSLVAGLAVRFAPDDVAVLLVDYKGGAAFGTCARLPHTLGVVTDLDRHLTRRVLRSLDAELRRRERILADAEVPDLTSLRARPGAATVPRLVIVVDEFATLVAELPDFVPGLVDIAQRGRSLGVHLVLATQRPGSAVSPSIRANTTLRIALRVTDAAESSDVVGTPAAARLDPDRPGRALIRTGRGVVEVQTARVTVPAASTGAPVRISPTSPWQGAAQDTTPDTGASDLDELTAHVDAAWAVLRAAGAPAPARTWLPPLPPVVRAPADDADLAQFAIGLRDLPGEQRRCTETVDLGAGGTVLVVGAARTGRSTFVHAVLARAVAAGATAALLDATGALAGLASSPGVVAHLRPCDTDAVVRLLDQLDVEVAARHARGRSAADGPAFAAPGGARPTPGRTAPPGPATTAAGPLLVVVDGWEAFVEALDDLDSGRSRDLLLGLFRSAGSTGLTALVTGGHDLLAPRVTATADAIYLLRLADTADYAMAGLAPGDVPAAMPPGRAVVVPGGHEVHLAVLGDDPAPAAQRAHAAGLLARSPHGRTTSDGPAPSETPRTPVRATLTGIGVRPLPDRVPATEVAGSSGRTIVVGIGGDGAEPVGLDPWAATGRLLVGGPPRSGRSITLVRFGEGARQAGAEVRWAAGPHSPLARWAQAHGLPGLDPHAHTVDLPGGRDVVVLVDDAADLTESPLSDALVGVLRNATPGRLAVVCSGRPDELAMSYRGVVAEVRRARRGLLLRPAPGDGDLIGIRTGRARAAAPAGRGVLVADGVTIAGRTLVAGPVPVQVAHPDEGAWSAA